MKYLNKPIKGSLVCQICERMKNKPTKYIEKHRFLIISILLIIPEFIFGVLGLSGKIPIIISFILQLALTQPLSKSAI